ncbi:MAG: hypothetical protein MJZ62_07500 [Bacteroidales bacterium]|nr:hypothetical protein [Bacteroidales bacterium]
MKKLLLVAFVAVFAFATTSCKKEKGLDGTTWKYHMSETETIQGMVMSVTMDATLNFVDETNGTLAIDGEMAIDGQVLDKNSSTEKFTYTFDSETGKGTMTNVVENANEQAETIEFTRTDDTHISIVAEGQSMVFTKE